MLRSKPPGEDPVGENTRAIPVPYSAVDRGMPPGEDRVTAASDRPQIDIEQQAAEAGLPQNDPKEDETGEIDFLRLIREAEDQALLYIHQVNRRAWSQAFRAFHQEHFVGSKYTKPDWRNRSKIFRPKTRTAVRKHMAAVAASLFNSLDAVNCLPGNEADPQQRAAAAVMQELVNYRTDRCSEKAALPWFLVSLGSCQDSLLTGICLSKQSWKLELRKHDEPDRRLEKNGEQDEDGTDIYEEVVSDVWVPDFDRPDCQLIPPENFVISPAADWATNPAQSAPFIILKWPMMIEEIRANQQKPFNPWKDVSEEVLKNSVESSKWDMAALRRAREMGLDRLDETQTGTHFQVIWVYETFMRVGGDDWTFYSVGDQEFLTDPKPVREVYPEQDGLRPLVMGYGNLEAHRIFPMGPVESWQQYQIELNDLANLRLDAIKQNVMPVSKIKRGRQIDLEQVKRRSSGSSIMVNDPTDITWERPPDIPQSVPLAERELELEFDDLAGQFNGQTAESNNALARTLGGLKLVSGSANAVQEFDIRVWITTWVEPVLAQIVKLEQFYESDPIVLGLCGDRAQLMQKHGISQITDELLENEVTIRVSIGLGAGDPQARLSKFQAAAEVVAPLLQQVPEFMSGAIELDWENVVQEVFGAVGYRDGGKRFFKAGQQRQNPMQDANADALRAKAERDRAQAQHSRIKGITDLGKVALMKRQEEGNLLDRLMGRKMDAHDMGFKHGLSQHESALSATEHGHRHGLALLQHQREGQHADREHGLDVAQHQHDVHHADRTHNLAVAQHHAKVATDMVAARAKAAGGEGGGGAKQGETVKMPPPPDMQNVNAEPGQQPVSADMVNKLADLLSRPQKFQFTRGPDGRINGVTAVRAPALAAPGNAPGFNQQQPT